MTNNEGCHGNKSEISLFSFAFLLLFQIVLVISACAGIPRKALSERFLFLFRVCQGRSAVTSVSLSIHPRRCKAFRKSRSWNTTAPYSQIPLIVSLYFNVNELAGTARHTCSGGLFLTSAIFRNGCQCLRFANTSLTRRPFFSLPSQYALQ